MPGDATTTAVFSTQIDRPEKMLWGLPAHRTRAALVTTMGVTGRILGGGFRATAVG